MKNAKELDAMATELKRKRSELDKATEEYNHDRKHKHNMYPYDDVIVYDGGSNVNILGARNLGENQAKALRDGLNMLYPLEESCPTP